MKRFFGSMLLAIAGGVIAVLLYSTFDSADKTIVVEETPSLRYVNLPIHSTAAPGDFTEAAETAVHAVVHVKTKTIREGSGNPFYDFFFGYGDGDPTPVMGFGSGVILTSDGYIVTNNHVIKGSEEVEVILNDKRSFDAEIMGTDPNTDLAVLKIRENNLPFLRFGNSDNLRLGEWVLAVGNPYNLTSTVTAGIVSAKARNIGILGEVLDIESFIQTDAAVNRGNSGGALVNTNGDLVGINAAIASRTGAFTGYSFAIPVSLVKKVVEDIIEYGTVQRALLGITIEELDADAARQNNIDNIAGVLVSGLRENGAAIDAGILENDVITAINGVEVNSPAELQEQVSRYRPNDKISVTINRKNQIIKMDVVLRNPEGGTGIVERQEAVSAFGASFEELSSSEKRNLGIKNGVRVVDVNNGKFRSRGIKEGYVITQINNRSVNKAEDVRKIVEAAERGIYIEGIYPDGNFAYYTIPL
ncbi:MAG: trypsin-like peptidase domain-containing protein [Bacteroidales bacterium]|nr:trypsin-like peptidase domain-containing protein [Bacteroidales bacterium]